MEEVFGEDGFDIYEMPHAEKISAERFSEFQKAYAYLTNTQKYEKDIYDAVASKKDKMLVVTEGSSDWKHMKAAYNKLSKMSEYEYLFSDLDFEFLEYEPAKSKKDTKLEKRARRANARAQAAAQAVGQNEERGNRTDK